MTNLLRTICCLNPECERPLNQNNQRFCSNCGVSLKLHLRNRYQPIKPLGKGGFGNTYLAKDIDRLNELCVIKQLTFHSNHPEIIKKAKQLFALEARQLQKLGQHPQIPTLLAYFEEDDYLYSIQEFIAGKNLFELVQNEGVFSEQEIIELLLDLLPVLQLVHSQNIIHRDLKPGNIMWREEDRKYVLIDFGISKAIEPGKIVSNGTIIGSQGYSPPEQIVRGQAFPNSDLFSLGVSCFYLLSKISPLDLWVDRGYSWLDNWQELIKIDLNPRLVIILDRLLQKDLDRRYQTAAEVIQDLREISEKTRQDTASISNALLERKIEKKSFSTKYLIALAIGVSISISGGFYGLYFYTKSSQKIVREIEKKQIFEIDRVNNVRINSFAEVWSLAVGSDRNIIASGNDRGSIELYNLNTGKLKKRLNLSDKNGKNITVRSLVLLPETNKLISGSSDGIIKIWNLDADRLEKELVGHLGTIWSLVISPDGQTLISSSEDENIIVWDLETGEPTFNSSKHSARVYSLAFSPDGKIFASSGHDNKIKIWDADKLKILNTLSGHKNAVRSIAISPNGEYLVSGSWDKTVKIWELKSGKLIHSLEGHTNRVVTVAFSRDSRTVFSGAIDNNIKVWNVEDGRLIGTLDRHSDWVLALASSLKENLLISSGKDGAIELWQYKYD